MNKFTVVLIVFLVLLNVALAAGGAYIFWDLTTELNQKEEMLNAMGTELEEYRVLTGYWDEADEEDNTENITEDIAIFCDADYTLTFPLGWVARQEGENRTIYENENGDEMMTIYCNFEGEFLYVLDEDSRTFTKKGQQINATYYAMGEADTVTNVAINLSPEPSSSDLWETYSVTIFLDPSLVDSGVAKEIFESIQ